MVRYVIVGGGVAGVCCMEELCRLCPRDTIILVSPDKTLKGVSIISRITKNLEELAVEDKDLDSLPYPNLEWIQGVVSGVDTDKKELLLSDGKTLPYDKLCVCSGAQPKRVTDSPRELALRDTQSVQQLCDRLPSARTVMVVGNGGIALELVHALRGLHIIWVMRHAQIGDAFFDLDAAQFLLEELQKERDTVRTPATQGQLAPQPSKPTLPAAQIQTHVGHSRHGTAGHAVGPAWVKLLPTVHHAAGSITLESDCEVATVAHDNATSSEATASDPGGPPVTVTLTNGRQYTVDLILAAAGVVPVLPWVPEHVRRAGDGGLAVDTHMQTSAPNVFAAGDACTLKWAAPTPQRQWFQMRLWSQARGTGVYAAHCMAGVQRDTGSDMAFELFTHVTRFLGKKVVLLGLYNGQGLELEPHDDLISYSRVTEAGGGEGATFVRVLLLRGRVQGAVMIGETDLEETFENLILDQLDVGQYGPHLLDPDVELDHVFD